MKLTMILACTPDGLIGDGDDLPWSYKEDLKWFQHNTVGKKLIMGRKTWDTIKHVKPLGRTFYVITRNSERVDKDTGKDLRILAGDWLDHMCRLVRELPDDEEVMVIGGSEIYKLLAPYVNKILLTSVSGDVGYKGDTYFPPNLDSMINDPFEAWDCYREEDVDEAYHHEDLTYWTLTRRGEVNTSSNKKYEPKIYLDAYLAYPDK